MTEYNVYQVYDEELVDDRGSESKLQFETGPYNNKQEAWKEASRLHKLYLGYCNFTVEPK